MAGNGAGRHRQSSKSKRCQSSFFLADIFGLAVGFFLIRHFWSRKYHFKPINRGDFLHRSLTFNRLNLAYVTIFSIFVSLFIIIRFQSHAIESCSQAASMGLIFYQKEVKSEHETINETSGLRLRWYTPSQICNQRYHRVCSDMHGLSQSDTCLRER